MITQPATGLDHIRDHYHVPARLGERIIVNGIPGTITGTIDHALYLTVQFDQRDHELPVHPTWETIYPEHDCGPTTRTGPQYPSTPHPA